MSHGKSVHSANIEEIHLMPISEIIRPIQPELDDEKVGEIVETLKVKWTMIFFKFNVCDLQRKNLIFFCDSLLVLLAG